MEIIELDVRRLYQALGHRGSFSQVHCQDPNENNGGNGLVSHELVSTEEELVAWARKHNGQGNCFIGRNPRDKTGAVVAITAISLDIDVVRAPKTASTDLQVAKTVEVGREILSKYKGGLLCVSGNGVLLLYPGSAYVPDDLRRFEAGCRVFENQVREEFQTSGVKIDATHDAKRLIKVLGTVSTKGDPKDWRHARFVSPESEGSDNRQLFLHIETLAGEGNGEDGNGSAPGWVNEALRSVESGNRNATFARVAGKLHREGWTSDDIIVLLSLHADRAGFPPDELRSIVRSISKYPVHRRADGRPGEGIEIHTPRDIIETFHMDLKERAKQKTPELPFGLKTLDHITWGLSRTNITTVGAWPGVGKTSLLLTAVSNLAALGKRSLIFSTEMTKREIIGRLISISTGIPGKEITTGNLTPENWDKVQAHYGILAKLDVHICDSSRPQMASVMEGVELTSPDVLIVDHLQHTGSGEDARKEIQKMVEGLKEIAKQKNLAVLIASQFRRPVRDLKNNTFYEPTLFEFAECGGIERESSVAILLIPSADSWDSMDQTTVAIKCRIAKNRHGEIGTIPLWFDRSISRFTEELPGAL